MRHVQAKKLEGISLFLVIVCLVCWFLYIIMKGYELLINLIIIEFAYRHNKRTAAHAWHQQQLACTNQGMRIEYGNQ